MKIKTSLATLSFLALASSPSSALVIMLSDLVGADPGGSLETFINARIPGVTEIRHADHSNFANSQDALNGTGAFAGSGAADVVVIGRSLSSGGYSGGNADGYNALSIPVISLTSYTVRNVGGRMGWHGSSTTTGGLVAGDETTVTAAGASFLGLPAGTNDLLAASAAVADTFNGLGAGTANYGGGQILASVGSDTLAAFWPAGSAPGDVAVAGVATFPGPRLLFNLDNDPNAANNGLNDLANMTPAGLDALANAMNGAINAVPEPSTGLLGFIGLAFLARRRR